MKELRGIPASPGAAVAPALVLVDEADVVVPAYALEASEIPAEWSRFLVAVDKARAEVTELRDRARSEAGEDQAAIFESHLLMMSDPDIMESMERNLGTSLRNIERVLVDLERELVEKLSGADDPSLRERAADIHDVSRRILGHLLMRERTPLSDLSGDVVLVARDILPSDMISLDRGHVKAVVTEVGGRTSHVAILARAFEIPAVLGVSGALAVVRQGMNVAVDGERGIVVADPDAAILARTDAEREAGQRRERELAALRDLPAETKDGRRILLKANIEVPEEAQAAIAHGADGVGLFRSEFLFLRPGQTPGEEEQYRAYRGVIETMAGRPVTIRTLDVGGDKVLPAYGPAGGSELEREVEKNPLLGWRAIRFCLSHTDIFKTQLRAILRAAVHGETRIMFPMIATSDELDRALVLLDEARAECRAKGQEVPDHVPTGIMIEIPSAALASDILSRKADFFSIGTNDLIQYTLAVDRGNQRLAYLNEPYNPAVLRLVSLTIENGRKAGIPVGMCGEMAADPAVAVLLLGLGLDEFSVSSVSLPAVKRALRSVSAEYAKNVANAVMTLPSSSAVAAYLASLSPS